MREKHLKPHDDPHNVYVYGRAKLENGYWLITIPVCPFCGNKHTHGGGDGEKPDGGFRIAHCPSDARGAVRGSYDIVFRP